MDLLNRRQAFLKVAQNVTGASIAGSQLFSLAGCKSTKGSRSLKEAAQTSLSDIDPIADVTSPSMPSFSGDQPAISHQNMRDLNFDELLKKMGANPDESADLVIVGGGIAGLAAGYLLRDLNPVIFDHQARMGGNSVGERWEGIEYSTGAAYFCKQQETSEIHRQLYKPLGLSQIWKECPETSALIDGPMIGNFWSGQGISEPKVKLQIQKFEQYLKKTAESDAFPDIPPESNGGFNASVLDLDRMTMLDHVRNVLGEEPSLLMRSVVEHYSWSSLNMTCEDVSAAAGVNFMAGDAGGICALPGGNAKIASLFLKAIAEAPRAKNNQFRTKSPVLKVRPNGSSWDVFSLGANGKILRTTAKKVVVAAPKFIARRLVEGLPADQSEALQSSYISNLCPYYVGNVLINEACSQDYFDSYLLGTNEDFSNLSDGETITKFGPTDSVMGQFAQGGHPNKMVLTLYWGAPWVGAQYANLFSEAKNPASQKYGQCREVMRDMAQRVCIALNLKSKITVDDVRINLFGHPMVNAIAGIYRSGVLQVASRPVNQTLFWANQDNWGIPSIESSLTAAIAAANGVRGV